MYQLLVNEQEVRNTLKSNIIALFVLLKSYNAETLLYIFFTIIILHIMCLLELLCSALVVQKLSSPVEMIVSLKNFIY